MAGPSLFGNLARGAKLVALLLFLLPWVTVSCSSQGFSEAMRNEASTSPPPPEMLSGAGGSIPLATASGLQLATGSVQLITSSMPQAGTPNSRQPVFSPEIGVIAGAALILLALLGSFLLKGGAGAIAGIAGSALAFAALAWSVFMHFPPAAREALMASNSNSGETQPTLEQLAQIVQVKPELGFYLTLVMLVLAILFNILAMRKAPAAAIAVPAPPPSEPPVT
jgi:hypothetical protein